MKTLFSADEPINLRKAKVPVEWLKSRFRLYIDSLNKLIKDHDVELVVHGGDFFDRYPNLDEIAMFVEYLTLLDQSVQVVMIDGNHEAAKKKGTSWLTLLANAAKSLHPNFEIIDKPCSRFGLDFLPYKDLKTFKHETFKQEAALVTHVRGEIPPHVKPEVDLTVFDPWDIVFAGDLHSHRNSQRNIVYPGSPVNTSFSRNIPKGAHGVLIFDTKSPKNYTWHELNLPYLLRLAGLPEKNPMPADSPHHVIYEVTGSFDDLADIEKTGNIEKRVDSLESESLLLQGLDSVEAELSAYLIKIMKVKDPSKHLRLFNDRIARADVE